MEKTSIYAEVKKALIENNKLSVLSIARLVSISTYRVQKYLKDNEIDLNAVTLLNVDYFFDKKRLSKIKKDRKNEAVLKKLISEKKKQEDLECKRKKEDERKISQSNKLFISCQDLRVSLDE